MKIRKALFAELDPDNKWSILIKDEDGILISSIAIPPTEGNRIDLFVETVFHENDHIIRHDYMYDFKGNIKKIKGEKLIIDIKEGILSLSFSD